MGNILASVSIFLAVLAFSIFIRHYFKHGFFSKIKFLAHETQALTNTLFSFLLAIGLHLSFVVGEANQDLIILVKAVEIFIITRLLFLASDAMANYTIKLWKGTEEEATRTKLTRMFDILTKLAISIIAFEIFLGLWEIDLFEVGYDVIHIIEQNNFTKAIVLFVIYLIIARLVLYICKTYLNELVRDTKNHYDDLILQRSEYSISWLIIIYGLKVTLKTIGYSASPAITFINTIIVTIVAVTLNVIIEPIIRYWKYRARLNMNEESVQVLANVLKILITVIAIFTVFVLWGIDLKSLLLSLGVLSVVLGFALRSTIDNIVSGISLMIDQSFAVGDIVKLGNDDLDENSEIGEVKEIGLRSTKIMTLNNQYLVVPNSVLATQMIVNYAKPNAVIRIVIPVAVAYGSDTSKVEKVLKSCLKGFKNLVQLEKIEIRLMELAEYSLNYEVVFYIDNHRDRFSMTNKVTTKIYNELKKNKIEIPFPTRTLYMGKGKTTRKKK